jgi:DNA-directed RNA polymerase specialized sigma24 family protein
MRGRGTAKINTIAGVRPGHDLSTRRKTPSRRSKVKVIYTDNEWLLQQGIPAWGAEIEHRLGPLVRQAVLQLPDKHREAVQLRWYGQYTYQQIAELLEWPSRGYAWMYCRRGMDKVRQWMAERCPELKETE